MKILIYNSLNFAIKWVLGPFVGLIYSLLFLCPLLYDLFPGNDLYQVSCYMLSVVILDLPVILSVMYFVNGIYVILKKK